MIFYTGNYLYLLFAASVIFWLIPGQRWRTWFLILVSTFALANVQLKFTLFLIMFVPIVYFAAIQLEKRHNSGLLVISLAALVVMLIGFKYTGVMFGLIFTMENQFAYTYLVPIGISYLSFKLIAFMIDIYRGVIREPKLEDLYNFILFLPIFPAGPIERFQRFANHRQESFDIKKYISGLQRILLGFFKKIVLVNLFLNEIVFNTLSPMANSGDTVSSLVIIMFLIGALVYAYFDLSAYADIAIGFGQLFGYQIYENMNYPIFRRNLSEYWNNWHMSLSHWCRNYVYFPMLGWKRNNYLALYSSFIVMGLWHETSLKWILWGMWHASGLTIFSHWSRFMKNNIKYKSVLPDFIGYTTGMILTILYSGLGFAFITQNSAIEALKLLSAFINI